jgi:pectin methylesterase-like acyl-CoA thioesterase
MVAQSALHVAVSRLRLTLLAVAAVSAVLLQAPARAQAPIALPNTISAFAGGGTATTAGSVCAANPTLKATDTVGNGCPATNAVFSTDGRGGLGVDGQGNVFVVDTNNNNLRRIDGRTGIVTAFAGGGTACGTANGQSDGYGDGCPYLQTGSFNHPRGVNVDPYGNVLIAHYGGKTVNVVCLAVSPLCPNVTGYKQVGSMYRVAGCVGSATATGTGISTPTNNVAASPFGNLPGDGVTTYGTCATGVGGVNQPRGVAGDQYGNVFIADTANNIYRVVVGPASWNGVANPMAAVLALNTGTSTYSGVTAANAVGNIYTLLGGFTAPASGATCAGPGGQTAHDAKGDGCPFYQSTAGGGTQGIAVDQAGDVIFADNGNAYLRVMYMGGAAMAHAISVNNGGITPLIGSVYLLVGGGASTPGAVPTLGTTTALDTSEFKVTVDPAGNIVIGDANSVVFFDIATGYVRRLFSTGSVCAAKLDALGDGCPASQSVFSAGGNGLGVGYDPLGNLYLTDTEGTMLVRKVSAASLVGLSGGTSLTQTVLLHGAAGTTAIAAALTAPSLDVTLGTTTCGTAYADNTLDCTVPVTFTPVEPGVRAATLAATAAGVVGSATLPMAGVSKSSALATDSAAPVITTLGTGIGAVSLAVDGIGSVYTMDTTAGKFTRITTANVTTQLPGALPIGPTQIAVDTVGSVYATGTGLSSIVKLTQASTGNYTAGVTANGLLVNPVVTVGGGGYTTAPTVTFTGGGGSGAAATAIISAGGVVTGLNLTANGSGYATAPTVSFAGGGGNGAAATVQVAQPQAVAVDALNNLFFADKASGSIYEVAAATNLSTLQPLATIATGLSNPTALVTDGTGNLYVADSGAGAVYKIAAQGNVKTTLLTGVGPVGLAADVAGDVYVQDSTTSTVYEVPVSGPTTTVLTGVTTGKGIAVDGNGILYEADSALSSIQAVQRQSATFGFGTNTALTFAGTLTDIGNAASTGFNQTDTADFQVVAGATNGCNVAAAQAIGTSCTVSATFTPQSGSGPVSDVVTLTPTTNTVGNLTLTATKNGTAVTTSTTIGGETPATPVYVASGTEVTFTVTVGSSSGTASGAVLVTVDTNPAVSYNLNGSAQAVVALSGLTSGSHTISASYATQNGFTGSSTASPTSFSIAQAVTTLTWTPTSTTQQFSAAIGAGALNATATSGGATVPGNVIYTATPAGGGAAVPVHSSSFLAVGGYSLAATFVPNDAANYSGATGSVASYTVTKATTTAAVGASQLVVAADGSGNFTSVQAAVNAVPATGGSVYVKPGTYAGDVTVVQPNLALRGLGGDPTQVVITHAGGAFSNGGGVYQYAGEFTTAQSNGAQLPAGSSLFAGDEGSATLVVAKGVNTAVGTGQLTPNGFYGENFTLANTYDTDNVTTTSTFVSGGNCTANAGAAQTYSALYNAGIECASQALAIWTVSDLSVMNNVYSTSLQDTIYAGSQGTGGAGTYPARQYWFRGKVVGDVDYIFGDAAAVFDYSTIYTAFHGTSATGTETIEAQNKARQTNGTGDYLSGYVMNGTVFTSQAPGMTNLYFGRPYGQYSTWIMLNSYVDQVSPTGYIEFSGQTNLPTSTYGEFNNIPYTDPATGGVDVNGVTYVGAGGSTGSGVTGTRETTSQDPGTLQAANTVKTTLTQAQAQQYFPLNFLSQTVSSALSSTANWNPNAALAASVNAFVPPGAGANAVQGSSVTLLMRPQTPGLGAITNGIYTIPTGTYTLTDSLNGGGPTTIASGTLDAAGEASFTTKTLAAGSHSLTWTYGGDANFSGSTTGTAYVLTVTTVATTTSIASTPVGYGVSGTTPVTVSVSASGSTVNNGTVSLTIDGTAVSGSPMAVNGSGQATFNVSTTGLQAGNHVLASTYTPATMYASSNATTNQVITQATLTVTGACANRSFGQVNVCSASVAGYMYSDTAATVFSGTPTGTTTAVRNSPAGSYLASPLGSSLTLTTFGVTNYMVATANGSFTVTGGAPQQILFAMLPNFPHGGSYQLTARTTSGLPVTYSITTGSGLASISGNTLTVTGTGVITVQAVQNTDPSGDYAAATPVSQTFTAP